MAEPWPLKVREGMNPEARAQVVAEEVREAEAVVEVEAEVVAEADTDNESRTEFMEHRKFKQMLISRSNL
jgi:hypothetical protein